jgi:hypothetical protein
LSLWTLFNDSGGHGIICNKEIIIQTKSIIENVFQFDRKNLIKTKQNLSCNFYLHDQLVEFCHNRMNVHCCCTSLNQFHCFSSCSNFFFVSYYTCRDCLVQFS